MQVVIATLAIDDVAQEEHAELEETEPLIILKL